jgi:p-hydroxybenzoate 3-monooxygenase
MEAQMKTQVAIIGGGPSGLLLSQLLHTGRASTASCWSGGRRTMCSAGSAPGVLEQGFIALMEEAGCADRLHAEGFVHDGVQLSYGDDLVHINIVETAGTPVVVYGQTEVTRDLYAAREARAARSFEAEDVAIHDADSDAPYVTYRAGRRGRSGSTAISSRAATASTASAAQSIPPTVRREYEKVYPFGWLGILSETPPVNEELIYASSERGFALCSMRNPNLSRYYIQCSLTDTVEDWSDDAFWDELKRRIPSDVAARSSPARRSRNPSRRCGPSWRADALGPAVPVRGRGAYRAADRAPRG